MTSSQHTAQLRDTVHPDLLYRHYDYMTSASKPLVEYFTDYASLLARRFLTMPGDLVVELGGNDGVLLGALRRKCRVLNVDPAEEIAGIAREREVPVIQEYFSETVARKIVAEHGPATVVTASNVLAHIDDLADTFAGVRAMVGNSGVFAVEVHWVGNLVGEGGFDQIYHEHLCYFSLTTLQALAKRHGLVIFDAMLTPMHGASLRVFMAEGRSPSERVSQILRQEQHLGLDQLSTYREFALRVEANRHDLIAILSDLRRSGAVVMGYGAPAKGNTLLDTCGLDYRMIDYLIDTTPFKQGLYTPGGHIPVLHPDEMRRRPPDYALLLAWNYATQILEKEASFRQRGGKFILPVPKVQVV